MATLAEHSLDLARNNPIWNCKDLIQNQLIDYVRATVVHAVGITHLRRIADFAALYQCEPDAMARRISRLSAWPLPSISPYGFRILAFRN